MTVCEAVTDKSLTQGRTCSELLWEESHRIIVALFAALRIPRQKLKYRKYKASRVSEFRYFATFTRLPSHIASTAGCHICHPSLYTFRLVCTVCELARPPAGSRGAGGQNDSHLCRRSTRSVCFARRSSFFPRLSCTVSACSSNDSRMFSTRSVQSGPLKSPLGFTVEIAK